jgi:hypothetical protein
MHTFSVVHLYGSMGSGELEKVERVVLAWIDEMVNQEAPPRPTLHRTGV